MEISITPSLENTCAVVVTYHPDKGIISRLRSIQRQLPSIFIIDNASSKSCKAVLREFSSSSSVKLLENSENEGIGKALNQAVSLAVQSGFLWMLTFDQDTLVHDDLFETLVAVYQSTGCSSPFIGSNYWNVLRDKPYLTCGSDSDGEYVERRTVITSGTLMKLDLFSSIGGFREDYFIDTVDHEYCLRVRANGLQVVMSCKTLMSQTIGRPGSRIRQLLTFDHPPIRKYYIARNTLVTLKSYFWREPLWAIRQLIGLTTSLVSIALFEQDKKNKGIAFCRGIIDATKNKMGRCDWI